MVFRLSQLVKSSLGRWATGSALLVGVAAAFALSQAAAAAGGGVMKVRFGGDQNETRVVIEIPKPAQGRVLSGTAAAAQVVLSLSDLEVAGDLQGRGAGLVKAWAVDESAGAARLRLDLSRPGTVKRRFLLPPGEGMDSYRYVMDIVAAPGPGLVTVVQPGTTTAVSAGRPASGLASASSTVGASATRQVDVTVTPVRTAPVSASATPLRLKKVVVIDAGHGGHDPGAHGRDNQEKDITLAAALALKSRLDRSGRYKVILTRDTDVFIPLENRVQIARHADADLFISLHADSGLSVQTRGASVYTLSDQGSDRVAKSVMDKNDWFIDVNLPGQDKAVKQILLDLTQRATKNRSASFAQVLLGRIGDHIPLLARSHRDAGFVVLLAPDVPAVLLEMGFMTNVDDESVLADDGSRQDFMDSVGDSIDAYFDNELRIASR